ncbi:type IV pilus modification protein PilV [Gayadomonas joobiniege]|uniref:type IV pilus modification protein PilV n=1 Tax=Gayadomonas joobiniege TaxID=1234606 RepID=UPI0003822B1B|nr:type IV pilus modification protein PilV [Gayadomonas joobiniege]
MKAVSCHKGFSLVELIIAMAVMAIGIVGAVATQATAKRSGLDASQRSKATYFANDIIERMRLNPTQLDAYQATDYGSSTFSIETEVDCSPTNMCSPDQLALYDQFQWHLLLSGKSVINGKRQVGGLIKPTGCIKNDAGYVTVVVSWLSREGSKDAAADQSNFEKACGDESNKRRQVKIQAHVH